MKKVIVTGAGGFIGSRLVKELSEKNVEVVAVVRKSSSNSDTNGRYIRTVALDFENLHELLNFIECRDVDVFYHLGWGGTSGADRENYHLQLNNIKYTCEAVKIAKKLECKKFIFAGSVMEYEIINQMHDNSAKLSMNTIYKSAKLAAHQMSKAVAASEGIDFICATISNIYGEGEISKRFVNSTLRKLLNRENVSFTSGEQLYDFIYIDDAINALIKMGELGRASSNYYIGNKKPRPLKEFILDMKDCVDKNMQIQFGEIPFDGARLDYTEFDTMSLFNEIGFECQVTFKDGIRKTIKWIVSGNGSY